ncbi:oxidoreductase [Microlunatus endophyticus]|uniref:Oxidoreductase n=1 Tax=Microlunatus endophyticus TaxID=1716077 RepID=A0A917SEA5_9ACTN|nr:aldo/keto reductase [Microlunatus endophyticus]GGL71580.1 oxidoreductase [Microlunatus endophyticus]
MSESQQHSPSSPAVPGGTGSLAGHRVARIGYGAMRLVADDRSSDLDWSGQPDEGAVRLLRRAVELGVDHIDTADFYGGGRVNQLIRTALAPYDDVVVATKIGARLDPGSPIGLATAQKPEELRQSVEDNLRSLGTDHLSLVYLRRTDIPPGIIAEGDQLVPVDDQLAELISLRDAGTVGAIGLGNVTAETIRHAAPAGIAAVQNAYSLVARDDEPALAACQELDIAWVPYFPLGGSWPGHPKVSDQPAVQEIATRLGVTTSAVGLAWLLVHAPNILLISGTSNIEHLEANLRVGSVQLDQAALAVLDELVPIVTDQAR